MNNQQKAVRDKVIEQILDSQKIEKPIGFCFVFWNDKTFDIRVEGLITLYCIEGLIKELVHVRHKTILKLVEGTNNEG